MVQTRAGANHNEWLQFIAEMSVLYKRWQRERQAISDAMDAAVNAGDDDDDAGTSALRAELASLAGTSALRASLQRGRSPPSPRSEVRVIILVLLKGAHRCEACASIGGSQVVVARLDGGHLYIRRCWWSHLLLFLID